MSKRAKKHKDSRLTSNTDRLPTIEECDDCELQNECEGGKYCVREKDAKKPADDFKVKLSF